MYKCMEFRRLVLALQKEWPGHWIGNGMSPYDGLRN